MGNSMPSMSATGVFMAPVSRLGSRSGSEEAWARRVGGDSVEGDLQLLDGGAHPLRERCQRVEIKAVHRGGVATQHPLQLGGVGSGERAPQAPARGRVRA